MEELTNIIQSDQDELMSSIDEFQADILKTFLKNTSNDYLTSADNWLNATTANTAKFGGEQGKAKIYRDKLLEELEKFLCGAEQYEEDRKKIAESSDKSQQYIIGVMSAAIGKTIGAAGTFIAPVIVLLILSLGKMALNAWCEMRKETKKQVTLPKKT
ncbi:MAG: hypothetical protein COA33_012405 [Fluviicola sp.]|nr:hypothetical protein [Fluviicola sp.]